MDPALPEALDSNDLLRKEKSIQRFPQKER